MNQTYYWYVLKTHVSNEDTIAKTIKEHVESLNLHDQIIEIQVLKNYKIIESEEIPANSDKLPEKSFRSTKKSQWLHLRNGNYMRVRIQEEKPYRGMIFIRMNGNNKLLQEIRTWVPGTIFLGAIGHPEIISDEEFAKMAQPFINQKAPDLHQYLLAKHWQDLMINNKRSQKTASAMSNPSFDTAWETQLNIVAEHDVNQLFQLDQEALDVDFGLGATSVVLNPTPILPPNVPTSAPALVVPTPELIIPPILKEDLAAASVPPPMSPGAEPVELTEPVTSVAIDFVVHQRVYLPKLETEGIIQEIKAKKAEVIVQIEMFGRSQNITVGPEEIQLLDSSEKN